jgi:hypothetical protein
VDLSLDEPGLNSNSVGYCLKQTHKGSPHGGGRYKTAELSWQQGGAAQQALRKLRAGNDLAPSVGQELGRSEVLL